MWLHELFHIQSFGFTCWTKMFYQYLRPLSWISNIFGVIKPRVSSDGKPLATNLWLKLWSLLIAIALITSYVMTVKDFTFSMKNNLEQLSDSNDLAINVAVILITLLSGDTCFNLYETIGKVFERIEFERKLVKLFALKMYLWFCIPSVAFAILIILEFINIHPPYILLIRAPTCLSALHLFMHLYVILALLKLVNDKLSRALKCYNKTTCREEWSKQRILAYVLSPDIRFIENQDEHLDLKHLCEIYDDLTTCNQLLEKLHGLQILLSIWQMFSCAVAGVTLIACDQAKVKWFVIVKTILPFLWSFIGCYIDDQLQKEVDQTNTLLIKSLIDYRCDPGRKVTLETFKELVSTNRLQFTACNLFNLNYAMLLGTILNVITYSIILIQFFLSD